MKSSDTFSTTTLPCPPSGSTPPHSAALTGRSIALDPRTHAVRPDLADIRLADKVLAPHYAAPLAMIAAAAAPVLETPKADAAVLAQLAPGDIFDVLEMGSDHCWGQRRADRIVGYVAAGALKPASAGIAA